MRLTGAAAGDLGGGTDLVLAYVRATAAGPELAYRVGNSLDDGGGVQRWNPPQAVPAALHGGQTLLGAGVALADLDGDGRATDLVVHTVVEDGGQQLARYAVGLALDAGGTPTGGWHGPYTVGMPFAGTGPVIAAGIAAAAAGRSPAVSTATATGLVNLAERARGAWRAGVVAVPRVGRAADPTDDLLDLLATDAVSGHVRVRGLLGAQLLANMWLAAGRTLDLTGYAQDLWQASRPLPETWGLLDPAAPGAGNPAGKPRLGRAAFEAQAVTFPWALAGDGTSAPDSASALAFAAKAGPGDLHAWTLPADAPLLNRLARHATLQAWADAALAVCPPDGGRADLPPWTEPELVDLADLRDPDPVTPASTPTAWRHLDRARLPRNDPQWPGEPPVQKVLGELLRRAEKGDQLAAYGAGGRRVVELAELRAALRWLATRPADVLARALGETLDVASHRLDAWLTAIATDRLRAMRRARPAGVQLGGYGAVTDLRARTRPASEGYLHAPSVGQAATAAVLRSGYLTHAGAPLGQRLALDLTSRRVRLAVELAAGVHGGHQLGALLGYRLERALHERPALGLARYLPALRQLAPLAAGKRTPVPAGTSVDAIAAPVVVDGLALLRAASTIPWGGNPPAPTSRCPPRAAPTRHACWRCSPSCATPSTRSATSASPRPSTRPSTATRPPPAARWTSSPAGRCRPPSQRSSAPPPPASASPTGCWSRCPTRPTRTSLRRSRGGAAASRAPRRCRGWTRGPPCCCPTPARPAGGRAGTNRAAPSSPRKPSRSPRSGCARSTWSSSPRSRSAATRWTPRPAPAGSSSGCSRCTPRPARRPPRPAAPCASTWNATRAGRPAATPSARCSRSPAPPGNCSPTAGPPRPATLPAPLASAPTPATRPVTWPARPSPPPARSTPPSPRCAPRSSWTTRAPATRSSPARTPSCRRRRSTPWTTCSTCPPTWTRRPAWPPPACRPRATRTRSATCCAALPGSGSTAPPRPVPPAAASRTWRGSPCRPARSPPRRPAGRPRRRRPPTRPARWPRCSAPRSPSCRSSPCRTRTRSPTGSPPAPATPRNRPSPTGSNRSRTCAPAPPASPTCACSPRPPGATAPASRSPSCPPVPATGGRRCRTRPASGWGGRDRAGPGGPPGRSRRPVRRPVRRRVGRGRTRRDARHRVVFHADAPGARAPQALLLACAADPARRWDDEELEHVVLDTLELARLRAVDAGVGPAGAPPTGHWFPAVLLARNTGGDPHGDTVATTLPLAPPPVPPHP
ncbi:hypothetical protein [Phytohabitans rumicis]|uniref:hypothetical protein n=1 Tax=Phytohabitans rumicis TaxID=1076125 RepID=UPI001567A228|nr:hypothetical protein [Phytohabitans rumicis]